MPKYIIINGPSRSGKDTIAKLLQQQWPIPVSIRKFAEPLRVHLQQMVGLPWTDEDFDNLKDVETSVAQYWITPRQIMIDYWGFLAYRFGEQILGTLLGQALSLEPYREDKFPVIITDCGRAREAEAFIHYLVLNHMASRDDFTVIALHREGTTFTGDSRERIDPRSLDCRFINITNVEGYPLSAVADITDILGPWVGLDRVGAFTVEHAPQEDLG